MSRKISGCECPGHLVTQIDKSNPQATSGTKLNSGPLSPTGRRVSQIPAWVPPSLKKMPVGITEGASDYHLIPIVDSFEKANSIYKSKLAWRGLPPPWPKSNARTRTHKKDTSISPVARATERLWRQSFSPNRLIERDTRAESRNAACTKFHDDSLGRTPINYQTKTAPSNADESALADRHNALNWLKQKRYLFPIRDSPRPQELSSPDSRRAELDFQRYGDLEGRGNAVSSRKLSPVDRRHEESRLYEQMIFASQHANSKARAEGVGELSLRI